MRWLVLIPVTIFFSLRLMYRVLRDFLWTFRYKNDPVLYMHQFARTAGPVRGVIVRRVRDHIVIDTAHDWYVSASFWPSSAARMLFTTTLLPLDQENSLWCRGHRGEVADAFRAFCAMEKSGPPGIFCWAAHPTSKVLCSRLHNHSGEHEACGLGFVWT